MVYRHRLMQARALLKATVSRRTLLVMLVVLGQGILAVHDAQHVDAQPSTCTVCQAHLPQIAGEAPDLIPAPPAITARTFASRRVEPADSDRPYESFRSRAPPLRLT